MRTGARVIITGGGSGIGAAAARAIVARGGEVVLIGRREDRLNSVAEATNCLGIPADIRDLEAVPATIERAVAHLGGLDAVVNAAGVIRPSTIADADPDDWRAMFETNVLGLLAVTRACLPHLLAGAAGTIVNVSSTSGARVGTKGTGTFSATKHAVNAISQALQQELSGTGVRVTTVMPGFVDTEVFDDVVDDPVGAHLKQVAGAIGLDAAVVGRAIADVVLQPVGIEIRELTIVPTRRADHLG